MPLKPGDTVDRYVIESLLGAGGMGEVYRARDTRLQRNVALKVLHGVEAGPSQASGSNAATGGAERLLREARAAAALEHANVVAVYDVGHVAVPGDPEGVTYLAMELIKGASLRSYMGDESVPAAERLRWLTDVARALGAAHRAGVVHRDVKPENVMIREDGMVKVLDFGIARRTSSMVDPTSSTAGQSLASMTAQGMVVGTPQYMAPEQLRADSLDGRADQFAWGVVAYELLTGKPPWTVRDGAIALVAQILSHEPPPIGTLADVPDRVPRVITRALRKERDARFPSMDLLIEALAGRIDPYDPTMASLPPVASVPRRPSREVEALASAPTEAVMTPPTSRGSSPASAAPSRPLGAARRGAFAALALVLAGATLVAGMKLRARHADGDASHAQTARPAGCTSNQSCIDAHGGQPWICRATDRQCASLASEDCKVLAEPGDVALDSTVWLGAMYRINGPEDEAQPNALELGRRDFAETLGKLADARHIGIVSCNASNDFRRVARHLAEDVEVPAAIVGTTRAHDIIEIVSKIFAPKAVLAMVPLSLSPLVTALPSGPSGRLVYRTTYSSDALLEPTTAFIESVLEPRLSPIGSNKRLRVAFVHNKALAQNVFFDRLFTVLRFNGKSIIDNGDDFRDVAYEEEAASYEAAARELVSFHPDLVVAHVSAAAVRGVIGELEKRRATTAPRPTPTYVFSQPMLPEMVDLGAADPSRRRRIFALDNISTTVANVQLLNHYNQTFDTSLPRIEAPGTSYDAFYALAYAIQSLPRTDAVVPSGPTLAKAFSRLSGPGRKVLVGPEPIFDAYRDLVVGSNIDLEGTSGHLDLDPETGESKVPIGIVCVEQPAGEAPRARESGLTYDEGAHAFAGSLVCP